MVATDVARYDELQRLVAVTVSRYGQLDILVNNAAVGYVGSLTELDPAEVEHAIKVNLLAPILLTRLAYPLMSQRAGAIIVNISSLAARVPLPYQSIYCAAKSGLVGFGESLRREGLPGNGVHVLTVYPGTVETEMLPADMPEKLGKVFARKGGAPEDVAHAILAGMAKRKTSLVIARSHERMMVKMNMWLPWLVDRLFAGMGTTLLEALRELNRRARDREAARRTS